SGPADHHDLHVASPCWSPRTGAVIRPGQPMAHDADDAGWPRASARGPRSLLLFILLGDDNVLDVCGVQHDGQDPYLALLARVPRHAVQAPGRLVERVSGLENLGGVVVDGPLVLALQDVAERRAGVAVNRFHLARL